MPDAGFKEMVAEVEDWYDPSPEFVETLSYELHAALEGSVLTPPSGRRKGSWLTAAVAMVAVVSLVGASVINSGTGAKVAGEAVVTAPIQVSVPRTVSPVCDRLVMSGAATGAGIQTQAASMSVVPGLPQVSIADMRQALLDVAAAYEANPEANRVMAAGLQSAISDFGLASLYMRLGEFAEAQLHLDTGRETLGALHSDPFFAACFGL